MNEMFRSKRLNQLYVTHELFTTPLVGRGTKVLGSNAYDEFLSGVFLEPRANLQQFLLTR